MLTFINYNSIIDIIYDQGLFIREIYDNLNDIEQDWIIDIVENLILSIVDDIIIIQAEKDNENHSLNDISSMLSHELVKLCTEKFEINILAWHLSQLRLTWIDDQIAQIERDHRELREIYQRDHLLQSQLKKCDHKTIFKTNWAIIDGKFFILWDFYEEIIMIFIRHEYMF